MVVLIEGFNLRKLMLTTAVYTIKAKSQLNISKQLFRYLNFMIKQINANGKSQSISKISLNFELWRMHPGQYTGLSTLEEKKQ
jgi:hypothetical protein